jgi:hypothetical protein
MRIMMARPAVAQQSACMSLRRTCPVTFAGGLAANVPAGVYTKSRRIASKSFENERSNAEPRPRALEVNGIF